MITDEKIKRLVAKIANYAESADHEVFGIPMGPESMKRINAIVRQWLEENKPVLPTFEEATEICQESDWAFAAVQPKGEEINWTDAANFYLNGFVDATKLLTNKENTKTVKNDPICKRTDCLFYNEKYDCYCSNAFMNPTTCETDSHYTKK
jgi:hypothetical protein